MTAPTDLVKKSISDLVERYKKGEDIAEAEKSFVDLTIMLDEQYPGDVGVLCVFFLNIVELKRGEAAFLAANMPHAYIKGGKSLRPMAYKMHIHEFSADIIECMATSDNVVRAGLTPKLRDVETLVAMLTYEAGPGSKQLLRPTKFTEDGTTMLYDPPIAEFSVLKVELGKDASTKHRAISGPSLCVVTNGNGTIAGGGDAKEEIQKGDVLFVAADRGIEFEANDDLEVFRAFVESAQ